MTREALSVFVTTLDNATTLRDCLASVAWADEIVVLDSGSHDGTEAIAREFNARWFVEPFKGYGPQKVAALAKTTHRWALLLDADEALTPEAQSKVRDALQAPRVAGFRLPRREQVFWQLQHAGVRHARMLRLFDKTRARMSGDPVHAAFVVDGPVGDIDAAFVHYGEPDIATKVDKVNRYSTGMVGTRAAQNIPFLRTRIVLQPLWHFWRQYLFRRKFLGGWAGFIGSVVEAFYVFLKYAKVYEARRNAKTRRDAGADKHRENGGHD
jgi:glycosyltransferase involved in cell wall biosynthesis